MFSSFFAAAADPHAQNFFPTTSVPKSATEYRGALEPKDTEWLCAGGFTTETQIWYTTLADGRSLMIQVIHSAVGMWYPNIQLTCKIFDPKSKEKTWRSVNVTNFVTPPPGLDKRSSKADQFSISHKDLGSGSEKYSISANYGTDLQITMDVTRPQSAPGWKLGSGSEGGYSYFGPDKKTPEGFVIHRFWPLLQASGMIVHNGAAESFTGTGMFVHAIQGMRPNLVASRWNFTNFQSTAHGGVTAIQMEFTTLDTHGPAGAGSGGVTVNIGSIVADGKLIAVAGETKLPGVAAEAESEVVSRVEHLKPEHDAETGYDAPTGLLFTWKAPSTLTGLSGSISAALQMDVGSPSSYSGLIEKVDVLAEIPYALKLVVNYVAGTKPYIYQWFMPATLMLKSSDSLLPGIQDGLSVDGLVYTESTFIS